MEKLPVIEPKTIYINRATGEVFDKCPEGISLKNFRIQLDWKDVPSLVDQSQRDENNISLLVKKFKPDELAQYLAAKNLNRQEIINHDFSLEPSLQDAKNSVYEMTEYFKSLSKEVRSYFDNKPADFFRFCDNPQNIPQLKMWGLYKEPPKEEVQTEKPSVSPPPPQS